MTESCEGRKEMEVNQRKAGALLNYCILFLNTLLCLAYTPYMLRMLGQEEYGLYSLVASVISYLTLLDLGFGNAIIRYTAKYRTEGKTEKQYEMYGMFLVLYTIIGVFSFLLGLGLYFNVDVLFGATMSDSELEKARVMLLLLNFNLAFTFPMSVFRSIVPAYERFTFQKGISIARIILNVIVMVLLLREGYKAMAMVVVQTIFNVLTLLADFWYCKYRLRVKFFIRRFDKGLLKEVSCYSFWIFLNAIMDKIYWGTGQFVLGMTIGTAAVAVFAVAIQFQSMYMQFSSAISGVFLPKVTNIVVKNDDKKQISDLFIRTGRLQYIVMSFILVGFILFGRAFICLWAGTGYEESYYITLLFFVPLTVPLIQNMGIIILQARNQMKFRSLLYICIALVSLVFQFVFSQYWGSIGCAIAISGALVLGQIIALNIYYGVVQNIDIVSFWKEIMKMSIVPIVMGMLAYTCLSYFEVSLDTWSRLFVSILFFSVVYIPLFFWGSMNEEEQNLILAPIRNIIRRKC